MIVYHCVSLQARLQARPRVHGRTLCRLSDPNSDGLRRLMQVPILFKKNYCRAQAEIQNSTSKCGPAFLWNSDDFLHGTNKIQLSPKGNGIRQSWT
jgi:hypothetical protein